MAIWTWFKLDNVFQLICILATLSLQLYCVSQYLQNEDVSVVKYTTFHSDKDAIYPSLSFCIKPPFLEEKLKEYGEGINMSSYKKFLMGDVWNERMLGIDHGNVTVSLSDNLLVSYLRLENEHRVLWEPNIYVSAWEIASKCFTLDVPWKKDKLVWYIEIYLKNSIFPGGKRSNKHDGGELSIHMHYPGQRITSSHLLGYEWPTRANNPANYRMEFRINNIDVLTHRSKPQKPCLEDWKNHDQTIMDSIMDRAGCRPPHWKNVFNRTLCTNPKQMKYFQSRSLKRAVKSLDPPCKAIERLNYIYTENNYIGRYFCY